jgi:hypothetical protein
VNNGKDGK